MPGAREHRHRLVHDAARQPHGPFLGPAARLGEIERRKRELSDSAERERDGHQERGRRRQPGAGGQVGADLALDPDRRAAERRSSAASAAT